MSYKKMEQQLQQDLSNQFRINQDITVTGSVSGNVDASIACATNISVDISNQNLEDLREQMNVMLEGGVNSRMVIAGKIGGNVNTGIGNFNFLMVNSSHAKTNSSYDEQESFEARNSF